MREVIYRAKVFKKKSWIYRQPFQIRGTWYMYNRMWQKVQIENQTICQFTGTEDTKGVRIYENDVVNHEVSKGVIEIGVIKSENGSFGVRAYYLDEMKKVEVIGNVIDNPELLSELK